MRQFIFIISIVLLVTAFADLHVGYGYYQILRWCVMIGAGLTAYNYKEKNNALCILFCVIAILFNPIAPIYLDKNIWKTIDLTTAVAFIFTLTHSNTKINNGGV